MYMNHKNLDLSIIATKLHGHARPYLKLHMYQSGLQHVSILLLFCTDQKYSEDSWNVILALWLLSINEC